jgi:transposase
VRLAKASISSGMAVAARSSSMRILCDQLEHTQKNLEHLQREIDQLLNQDPKSKGMLGVPEFGPTTVAVLRAELGDLTRFTRIDQVVAYVGLDRARSNRAGNGKGRPSCPSMAAAECAASCTWPRYAAFTWKHLPLGLDFQRLVARGMKQGMAGVAVMRNMLSVAVHLIQTEEHYDPGKVAMQAGS